jgi:hypothetical protein
MSIYDHIVRKREIFRTEIRKRQIEEKFTSLRRKIMIDYKMEEERDREMSKEAILTHIMVVVAELNQPM